MDPPVIPIHIHLYQLEPHKAVAEVSKMERFVVVSHGWQSKSTDGFAKVVGESAYLFVYLSACLTN